MGVCYPSEEGTLEIPAIMIETSQKPDKMNGWKNFSPLDQYGILGTTALISGVITVISTCITLVVVLLLDHPLVPDLFLAIGTPLLLAPPVAYLMSKFKGLYAEAESANKTKSEFLSKMSHELHSPLHGIIGLTGALLEDPVFRENYREEISAVNASGQQLLELFNDILDFAKIEADVVEIFEEYFDLHLTLESLINRFKLRCETKGLSLKLDWNPDVPQFVRGDSRKLRQILLNLVSNAFKFTVSGGIHVTVAMEGEDVCFRVADTGIGIPQDHLDGIFDPFSKSNQCPSLNGTGLGLAISRRFVDFMRGQLTVESKVDQGSVFSVRVPLACMENNLTMT